MARQTKRSGGAATTQTRAERYATARDLMRKNEIAAAVETAFGPTVMRVRRRRRIFWPGSSEVRYSPGELVFADDPLLEGQTYKLEAYDGDETPTLDLEGLSRGRRKLLLATFEAEPEPEPSTAEEAPSPRAAAKRAALEETDGEVAGLDA
jgi:hypothetical protein